ncbi:MAG: mevalonate kinase [Cenarchaeum symbiont of Oopsacas minuta]|nr:mevalonate kinase [Cenarchaeum symbiont of Oopsacas minuta]
MTSTAVAPAKVILFGEHFVVHGTSAVLCAIDMLVQVAVTSLEDDILQIESKVGSCKTMISNGKVTDTLGPLAYIARKISKKSGHSGGMHIIVNSHIPSGAGLGSSSACCVAATCATIGLFSECTKEDIVEIALQAERTMFVNASGADSAASAYGGVLCFNIESGFKKLRSSANLSLLVANSGIQRSTDNVVSGVGEFRANNVDRFEKLCQNESKLISKAIPAVMEGDLEKIGEYFGENQSYLEEIGVSNNTLDKMIKITDEYGYGSKITGAGGGGCIISAVPIEKQKEAIEALTDAGYVSHTVNIDHFGARMIH